MGWKREPSHLTSHIDVYIAFGELLEGIKVVEESLGQFVEPLDGVSSCSSASGRDVSQAGERGI